MADDTKIEIEIVLDDGSIKKGFATISKESKDLGSSLESNLNKSFGTIALSVAKITAAAIAAGVALAGVIAKKSIDAASEYQEEVNKLNVALASSGQFSKEASEGFLEFANALQETTKFSDDAIVSSAALIQNIARLNAGELQRATKSSLDLASALGIDLETAANLVAKSANGNIAAFARYGIEIRKGASDTETFSNTLKTLEGRFAGAAEATSNTFAGSIEKAKNAFGDIFKEIGLAVVRSPALTAFIGETARVFTGVADSIKKNFGTTDIFKDLIINFSVIAQAGIETGRQIGLSFELAALRAQQAWYAFKVLSTAGLSETFNKQLDEVNKKIDETKSKFSEQSAATGFFDNLITKVSATNGQLTGLSDTIKNNLTPATKENNEALFQAFTSFEVFGSKFVVLIETSIQHLKRLTDAGTQAGQLINQALTSVAVKGIQTITNALLSGKASFKDFGNFILQSLGDLATQMGTLFISAGIGMLALASLSPFQAIAAGAALVALGAIIKSSVGSGAASGVTSTGGGGSSGFTGDSSSSESAQAPDIQEKQTNVKIDVGGTVLSPNDVGRQIAQILSDTFEATGTKVVTS